MKKIRKLVLGMATVMSIGTLVACGNGDSDSQQYTHEVVELNFGGSTSAQKIVKALTQAFDEECKYFNANHNFTGSSDAYKFTQGSGKDGTTKLHVGFLSRELNLTEPAKEGTSGIICKDGIVAVTNSANNKIDDVTGDQLKTIYSTENVKWSDITGNEADTANISRYSRDAASGTRDGFFTTIGYSEAKTDDTKLPGASIVSSNGDMIARIKNDVNGVGYISLASLSESGLKGLKYEGVVATEQAVVDGTYGLQRNFNYVIRDEEDCSEAELDVLDAFMKYLDSREALTIIASNDGILTKSLSSAKTWREIKSENPEVNELCS